MIMLQKIFDELAHGELSSTVIGSDEVIKKADYPRIISHINLGLMELYKRFNLMQKEVKIYQQEGVNTYYLRSEFMGDENEMGEETYLLESEFEPFDDDVIRVLEVYDSNNKAMGLNDMNSAKPVYTPSYDILNMTVTDTPEIITVVYQAKYPEIRITSKFNPAKIELNIPDYIEEALLFYVAARVFRGIKASAGEGEANPANTFNLQYETACKKIDLLSLAPRVGDTQSNFLQNGWA